MSITLRDFRNFDFQQLWHLDQACFPAGIAYSRTELMHYMTRSGAFTLIAEDASPQAKLAERRPDIVGFLVAQEDRRQLGHIITIDVHKEARRKGVGVLLMEAAEARLRQRGCVGMYLETAVNNDAAIAFYKRLGYSVLQTIPHYYQGDLDALLMGKRFSRSSAPKPQVAGEAKD